MTNPQHAWVVEVLQDIRRYADKFDLIALRDSCRLAYDAALDEVGKPPVSKSKQARQQGFIDALRELIDFTEAENQPRTRLFLIQALTSAAAHLDHPQIANTVIRFPFGNPGKG